MIDSPARLCALIALWLVCCTASAARLDIDPAYGAEGRISFTGRLSTTSPTLVQPDGKLITFGSKVVSIEGNPLRGITRSVLSSRRFNSDGSVDISYGSRGESQFAVRGNDFVTSAALQNDGHILLGVSASVPCSYDPFAGRCSDIFFNTAEPIGAAVRLLPTGVLDKTFGGLGVIELPEFRGGTFVAM